ncbi:helix-turn-helix domain-containing protein, partial [Serratia nevei]
VAFLTTHSRRARRIASVCTGAFILAACGLLDGKRATTHWYHAARLQQSYPRIRVDSNRIFIRDGDIWTSAGISAGIDLALALIEDDLGATLAAAVARQLVVYHRRPGGQSQYSLLLALNPSSDRMRAALSFAREHLHLPLSVADLADAACLSERQFGRLFRAETGQTPAKVIEQLRVEAARVRIEESAEPLEAIARSVGFSDPERMRRAFIRVFGLSPQAIRRLGRAG